MRSTRRLRPLWGVLAAAGVLIAAGAASPTAAQSSGPVMLHPRLGVRPVAEGLDLPITMAFIGTDDMLVLEKNTGQVQRVVDGVVQSTVLDLAVNSASERGLLGIALHPDFPTDPGVYLYWTREHDRRGHRRVQRDAAAGQPRRSL